MTSKMPAIGSVWRTVYDISIPDFSKYYNSTNGVNTVRFPETHSFKAGEEITIKGRCIYSPVKYGDFIKAKIEKDTVLLDADDFRRLFENISMPDHVVYVVYSKENGRYLKVISPDRTDYTTLKCAKKSKSLENSVDWLNGCSGFYTNGDYFYQYPNDRPAFDIPDDFEIRKVVNGEVTEGYCYSELRAGWERYKAVYERYGIFVAKLAKNNHLPEAGYLRVEDRNSDLIDKKIFKGRMLRVPSKCAVLVPFDNLDDILYYCIVFECGPDDIYLTADILTLVK